MTINNKPVKYTLITLLLLLGFIGGWYAVIRIVSPFNVVKTFTLNMESTSSHNEPVQQLKVGCYNIAHGRGNKLGTDNWDGGSNQEKITRLEQIADLLVAQRLDIVVLNEVDLSSYWSGHIDQSKVIAKQAGYPYIVQQRNVDVAIPWKRLCFGNVILSKFPIVDAALLNFPNPSRAKDLFVGGIKDGVTATITLPDTGHVQVVAVHLSLEGETTRTASVEMMLDLQRQSGLPMIAMGDFNSTVSGYPHHYTNHAGANCIDTLIASSQLETFPLKQTPGADDFTFPSENPTKTIDWIFVTKHWEIKKYSVLPSDLSDHLPVVAELTLSTD